MRTRKPVVRVLAAAQATLTAFAVLFAAHHTAEIRHVQTASGTFVHAALDAAPVSGDRTLSDRTGAAVDDGACELCQAAHTPVVFAAPPRVVAGEGTTLPSAVTAAAVAPRAIAILRTAPKTSPPV